MTSWIIAHSAPLVATAAVLMVMYVILSRDSAAYRDRAQRLASSSLLFDRHAMLMEKLVTSEKVPDALKLKLLAFSGAVIDDETFLDIWRNACVGASTPKQELSAFDRDLANLYSIDAELGSCLELAVSSLSMAMVLKSEDAQEHLAEAFAQANSRAFFVEALEAKRFKTCENRTNLVDGGLIPV